MTDGGSTSEASIGRVGPLVIDVPDEASIAPETRAMNQAIEQMFGQVPPWQTLTAPELRRLLFESDAAWLNLAKLPQGQERTIPGPAGEIPLRVFMPGMIDGVYLHIHGGGWTIGRHDVQDVALWSRAERAGVAVVSVGYRLAPEHPYPAGPDDCEAAALWLIARARSEFGTERIVIGGESAGAHLAAVTLLRLRDRHQFVGFRGAELRYGCFDLRMTPSQRSWGEYRLVLSTPEIEWCLGNFVPPERRDDPDVSPLLASLEHMPPALFTVGTLDPLLDDSLFMAARWRAAGNPTELRIYPGGSHIFDMFPSPVGLAANEDIDRFLASAVAAT